MARVTVEDCVERIPNRFELVMLAAQRSRDIAAGSQLTIERDDDKNPVVALREIADQTVDFDGLRNQLVKGLQKVAESDEPEEEIVDFLAGEQELARDQVVAEAAAEEGLEEEDEEGGDLDEEAVAVDADESLTGEE